MKKITAILVCLLLVASLAVTAFAAEEVKVTIATNKSSASRGDVIDVTISISEMAECRSAGLIVIFDKEVFEFVKNSGACTQSDANMPKCQMVASNLSCSFTYDEDATPASISGELFSFKLKVLDAAAFAESSITLKDTSSLKYKDGTKATLNYEAAKVNIVCSEHAWDNGVETTAATCEADGVKTFTCSACGATKEEAIAKLGHTEKTEVTKEATCKEAGEKKTTCTVCSKVIKTEEIAKLAHTEKTEVTKEATCKEAGEKKTTCTVCSEVIKTEEIAKLAHTEETKVTKEATCAAEGEKVTTCTVCSEVIKTEAVAKLPHTLGEYTETKAPTCSAEGEKTATCSVCQATETAPVEKLAHTWNEGEVTTPATTKKEGVKTFTCTVCQATKTEALPKLETPATGDNTMIVAFVALMVLSAAGIAVTVIGKKKFA